VSARLLPDQIRHLKFIKDDEICPPNIKKNSDTDMYLHFLKEIYLLGCWKEEVCETG
jgi:hypothetical protein